VIGDRRSTVAPSRDAGEGVGTRAAGNMINRPCLFTKLLTGQGPTVHRGDSRSPFPRIQAVRREKKETITPRRGSDPGKIPALGRLHSC